MLKKTVACILLSLWILSSCYAQSKFAIADGQFLMNGKPYRIFSGEMHYARIPHEYWKDRLMKLKATGLNTVCTYAFWNFHEVKPGVWDFSGDKNIAGYIKTAQEVGLNVILRPGPYVCAEWDFGGMPAWLLKNPDLKVRSRNDFFLAATEKYINRLARELKPLLATNGGPIIMVQLENEYGAFGSDKEYLIALKDIYIKAGFNVPLYAADNPPKRILDNSFIPGVMPVLNFGQTYVDKVAANFRELDQFGNIPQMCGEFWTGWFTPWEQKKFATRNWDEQKADIGYMLENGKSFNLYMIHGGTNFGFTAGAMEDNRSGFQPDITSYDYDAPINEMGEPTTKCRELKTMLQKYETEKLPSWPAPLPVIEIPEIHFDTQVSLWNNLPVPVVSHSTLPMENLDQQSGYILYRTKIHGLRPGMLKVNGLHDYATVFINKKFIGSLDRLKKSDSLLLPEFSKTDTVLDILVEALGHINYSQRMNTDRKGISEGVTLEGVPLYNWSIYSLPMDKTYLDKLLFIPRMPSSRKGKFFKGDFFLKATGDTYLDMSNYGKGFVSVNGRNLGRFWNAGPQQRLYCPAPYLKKGKNEIVVFDMLETDAKAVKGVKTLQ